VVSVLDMVQLGFCCGIIPAYYLDRADPSSVRAFRIPGMERLDSGIIYRKNSYLTDAAHAFIGLAAGFWEQHRRGHS